MFTGVSIRQFPRGTDQGDILELLVNNGLPETKTENVSFNNNGTVIIKELENKVCLTLIEAIHGANHFDRKLYCNGVIPLTPEKQNNPGNTPQSHLSGHHDESKQVKTSESVKLLQPCHSAKDTVVLEPVKHLLPGQADNGVIDTEFVKPLPPQELAAIPQFGKSLPPFLSPINCTPPHPGQAAFNSDMPDLTRRHSFSSRRDLVGRHSISLVNRSPNFKSLAAEILGNKVPFISKSILNNMVDIQDSISDFGSCLGSSSSSSDESGVQEESENNGFLTVNNKKRLKKAKRKLNLTTGKEQFLKKPKSSQPQVARMLLVASCMLD